MLFLCYVISCARKWTVSLLYLPIEDVFIKKSFQLHYITPFNTYSDPAKNVTFLHSIHLYSCISKLFRQTTVLLGTTAMQHATIGVQLWLPKHYITLPP